MIMNFIDSSRRKAARHRRLLPLLLLPVVLQTQTLSGFSKTKASQHDKVLAPLTGSFAMPIQDALYARQYIAATLQSIDRVDNNLPEITRIAQIVADRHIAGGMIGSLFNGQALAEELTGRSGGLINYGFDRGWETERTPQEDANNVLIVGWERAPSANDLAQIRKAKADGNYVIAIGPRAMPELAAFVPLADAWLDTGFGADDRLVGFPNGQRAGRGDLLVNMLNGWALTAEIVSALTRKGKTPPMYQSYMTETGRDWAANYFRKKQFHDDNIQLAPIAAGVLAHEYLDQMREHITRFRDTQLNAVQKSASLIVNESKAGRKTIVATAGHAPFRYVAHYEDAAWAKNVDYDASVPAHVRAHEGTPEGALVLRLGYTGMHRDEVAAFAAKNQRVLLVTSDNPRPEWQIPKDKVLTHVNMGWVFGDAAVTVPGYPIRLFPPSGILQIIAYESINTEVLAALSK